MPRITESEIERIQRETDLTALVRARGVELHKHGSKDLAGKCPFHADDQPSFIVSPEKGLFHCMVCGAAGNAIQFVEKFDGVSLRHAFELLNAGTAAFSAPAHARRAGAPPSAHVKKASVPRLDSPLDLAAEDDAVLMGQVVDYYHERLLKTPAALDYLGGRGLFHEEALRKFRVGFSDRTLGLHLPQMNRKDGEAIRTRLQKLGIYRPNGREHFNGCIVLPVFGNAGEVCEMYGRRIASPEPGQPKHLFLPGPHKGIWNAEALEAPKIILCAAPFDALTFWVNGIRNVTFI
ncbi:MAG: CHC2 zinc finger domain-containing protein, partial [Kiritimatiellia bacterium]